MSADKHRSLARRIAYLRLASRGDIGFAVQVKWGYAVTPDVTALEGLGYLRRSRNSAGGRKRVTCMVATPAGQAFLQKTLARRGQDFGPVSLIRTIDPRKILKDERRKAASQIAGYTSHRVYPGIRTLDLAARARRPRSRRELNRAVAATEFLRTRIDQARSTTIRRRGKDRYGRTLARIGIEGQDLGRMLVRAGHGQRWT